MNADAGSNLKQVKRQNLALALKYLAQGTAATRVDLARAMRLSKMTVTNLVAHLLEKGYLQEQKCAAPATQGRPAVDLCIAADAPLMCGMLIKRGLCQVVLTDLCGTVRHKLTFPYPDGITKQALLDYLKEGFFTLKKQAPRIFPAVGIASVGPLDSVEGKLLQPADFYGICDFDIVKAVEAFTGLPAFLINDANAGALAETLYGRGRQERGFVYLHIMNGIGAGLNLDGSVYVGQRGLAGELGHTSINFAGPLCSCGNRGCLDVYANLGTLQSTVRELAARYPDSPLCGSAPSWFEIVAAAMENDPLALAAMDVFCRSLYHALGNLLSALDVSTVILGYPAPDGCHAVEDLLRQHLHREPRFAAVRLLHSAFGGDAPLIGAAALVADKIFRGEMEPV